MSSYPEDEIHQLSLALKAAGYSNSEVRKLRKYPELGSFRLVLTGRAEIRMRVPDSAGLGLPALHKFTESISGEHRIVLPELSAQYARENMRFVFGTYVPREFEQAEDWASDETEVLVEGLKNDGTYPQIFHGFSPQLEPLCLSRGQITYFRRENGNWLGKKGTSFLFKRKGLIHVARMSISRRQSELKVQALSNRYVWKADLRHHFVVPKLARR